MRALIYLDRPNGMTTIVKLAEKMRECGFGIILLLARTATTYAANQKIMESLNFAEGIYVLLVDRELEVTTGKLADGIKSIDYDGFIELLENCDKIISWA